MNYISTVAPAWRSRADSRVILVALGVALLTLAAKVQVPFWPVPMTLQTFAVLTLAAAYGARLGTTTVLSYVALGAVGAPVFATGAGPLYLLGPTGGYLAGFIAASALVGWLADRGAGRSILSALVMFLAGEIVIFCLGAGWLASLIGAGKAISAGVLPFLPGEVLKIALATAVSIVAWKRAA
jgi:biotin transport system substrate-specific component